MGKIADIIKKILYGFFNDALKSNLDFFKKPNLLVALQVAALALLTPLLAKLKALLEKKISKLLDKTKDNLLDSISNRKNITDENVENYVKNNRNLQRLLNYAGNDLNEDLSSDVVLACGDPDYYDAQTRKLKGILSKVKGGADGNDLIRIASEESDFDERIDGFKIDKGLQNILSEINGVLPWVFMVYIIILKIKEFLTQNDHPSKYRGKYLQRLIRLIGAILKKELNSVKAVPKETKEGGQEIFNQMSEMINALKSLDAIIVASLMATFIYINNRKQYQDESLEAFSEVIGPLACGEIDNSLSDEETSNGQPLIGLSGAGLVNGSCPIEIEEPFAPHEPFEDKMENDRLAACEVIQNTATPTSIEEGLGNDFATKALFENNSSLKFNISVKKNQRVTSKTVLGTLGESKIYSPIEGIVSNIKKNKITVDDISDPEESYFEELIQTTQDLFTELTNVKIFIKDFYVNSWYPVMLHEAPPVDASTAKAEKLNIQFWKGGVWKHFEKAENSAEISKENYELRIQEVTGEDNAKEKSENEELEKIQEEIEAEEKVFYEEINYIAALGKWNSQFTLPEQDEYTLIEYYFDLYQQILSFWDQNNVIVPFRDKLSKILTERFFIDEWNEWKLKERINTLCNEMAEGTYFEEEPDYFYSMIWVYQQTHNLNKVRDYVVSLGKNNEDFTEDDKQEMADKIMFNFEFVLEILQRIENKYTTKTNALEALESESNFISNYFGQIWKRYRTIPKELKETYKKIDDIGNTLTTYSIISINDEEYRYYAVGKDRECPLPAGEEGDDYTSPFSEYEFKDIKYWLRYCAFATLASVTNPATGWSTGIPPPFGPIRLPVIYIPIRAFQLNWGFIVIGISICGIYPFPWVLVSNLSTQYHVPIADPASIIKTQIQNLKKVIKGEFKEYRQAQLKQYLENTTIKIDQKDNKIDDLTERKRQHKLKKPKRDRTKKNNKATHVKQLAKWDAQQVSFSNQILKLKRERFSLETKYHIVYSAYSGNDIEETPDAKIKSMKKTEDGIDKKFEKLDGLVNKIEPLLAPLPIATKPESANFMFTIKNPKPIINFKLEINDNINNGVLDPIVDNFKLKNEDLMASNFSSKSEGTFVNWKKYQGALRSAMPLIITKDPFPKYQNLKLTNIPWITFLYTDWVPAGAKTYGFPFFPPVPIG